MNHLFWISPCLYQHQDTNNSCVIHLTTFTLTSVVNSVSADEALPEKMIKKCDYIKQFNWTKLPNCRHILLWLLLQWTGGSTGFKTWKNVPIHTANLCISKEISLWSHRYTLQLFKCIHQIMQSIGPHEPWNKPSPISFLLFLYRSQTLNGGFTIYKHYKH